jgi:fructose-bisphosphate aldolase class II
MLESARTHGYALPALNVDSSEVLNGVLAGLAASRSDGIVQVSPRGGAVLSGRALEDMTVGAEAFAEFGNVLIRDHPTFVAMQTDHCPPSDVDHFLWPLLAQGRQRIRAGEQPLFQGHMLDASKLPLPENLRLARRLLGECSESGAVLEIEIGVVGGGDETGATERAMSPFYISPEELVTVVDELGSAYENHYLLAAAVGNVHGKKGAYDPPLKPSLLREGQHLVAEKYGPLAVHNLVFHGGSGTPVSVLRESISCGVVKVNFNSDVRSAFAEGIVLGIQNDQFDGDYRLLLESGEERVAERVKKICGELGSAGRTLNRV